jgi:tetratricopeptide (TPR) repeat protein
MSSTTEEWAATARTLFDHRRYLQAVRCYERANLPREKDVAYAYYLREQARGTTKTGRTTDISRTIAYTAAADAFLRSASVAAVREETLAYYRNAAECWAEIDEYRKAAAAYLHAEEFTLSAQHYRRCGLFDEAVAVVQEHRHGIPEADATVIIDVAKLHYVKESRLE